MTCASDVAGQVIRPIECVAETGIRLSMTNLCRSGTCKKARAAVRAASEAKATGTVAMLKATPVKVRSGVS